MGQSSGWFLLRQIHRRFPGQLRPTFFTVFGIGKFAASALASRMPHSVCTWLRQLRAASFTGQASVMRLWHHRPSVWRSKQAAMARRVILGPCCLTTHSSRRRSAARLNSGVRPQWSKGWVVPTSANPLMVSRSAPATVPHHFRYRQVRGFGFGVMLVTLGLHLASVVPRVQLCRASLVSRAVASSAFVVFFKQAAMVRRVILGPCCLTTHSSRRGYRHAA